MIEEVGITAHSCGVPEPRLLGRQHCRVVMEQDRSLPLDAIYPYYEGKRRVA